MPETETLRNWLHHHSSSEWSTVIKYLSGNDTGLTKSHQSGVYVAKEALFRVVPGIHDPEAHNPDKRLRAAIDSHLLVKEVRAVWYNSGTRNETRITRWGGQTSPMQDPENTGGLCLLSFANPLSGADPQLRVWLCRDASEEEYALDWFGVDLDPGGWRLLDGSQEAASSGGHRECDFLSIGLPNAWTQTIPSGRELVDYVVDVLGPCASGTADTRLLCRRDCEYSVFGHLEKTLYAPRVKEGFSDLEEFIALAHTVTNARKSRSGRSLELHLCKIFDELGVRYSHNAETENGKTPDFVIPSIEDYHKGSDVRILGVKTTCKDRWRQVLDEAEKVPVKHLFTLQEGVSELQFQQMKAAGLRLVVPTGLHGSFPESVRPELMDLEGFIAESRGLAPTQRSLL